MKVNFYEKQIPDEIWWRMCDIHMGLPKPLHEADLTKGFIFDRRYGVFPVDVGYHHFAASFLVCLDHGVLKPSELTQKCLKRMGLDGPHPELIEDYYLMNQPGSAKYSTVTRRKGQKLGVLTTKRGSLNALERRILREFKLDFIDERLES